MLDHLSQANAPVKLDLMSRRVTLVAPLPPRAGVAAEPRESVTEFRTRIAQRGAN